MLFFPFPILPILQQLPPIAASSGTSGAAGAVKGKALGKKKAKGVLPEEDEWVADDDPEPTQDEALVQQSCPGTDLQTVRQMIHLHGDWETAVEAIIAAGELEESPVASGSSSTRLARNGKLLPPNPLPDHLRQYRATSPASVETNGTRSSEGGSTSTTATTEELSPIHDNSRSASPMVMPRHKRAASSDIMSASMTRSPKRRSRSRSPADRMLGGNGGGEGMDSDTDSRRASMDVQVSHAEEGGSNGKESTPSQSSGSANTSVTTRGTPASTSKVPPKAARQTARQKRDAEQQRKRERNQAKVTGKVAGGKGTDSNSRGSTAEVKGFIELKI